MTVGTHEQPFNRLVEYMDTWAASHNEEVVIQIGYSTYMPINCQWKKLFPYKEMVKKVDEARVVITHGGPSSFIMPLQIGKTPIVVPRRKEFGEHVNNHQVSFCKAVEERHNNIIVVETIERLEQTIEAYELLKTGMRNKIRSNNELFCENLEKIVDELLY